MKPIKFNGCNVTYAKNQPEYIPLPAAKDDNGMILTCWKSSLKERIVFLFTGKMWLWVKTFNNPLQPVRPEIIHG